MATPIALVVARLLKLKMIQTMRCANVVPYVPF